MILQLDTLPGRLINL